MRLGSLFTGSAQFDLAVEQVFGASCVWQCENDDAASRLLTLRRDGIPNHGDVTAIDWRSPAIESVDVLCGGFPCQDLSAAGRRAGITPQSRSGLWVHFADAIDALQPSYVAIENVKGILDANAYRAMESAATAMGDSATGSVLRALGAVLGDLCDLGYDAQWATVSAASVGACHLRQRVFVVAQRRGAARRKPDRQFKTWDFVTPLPSSHLLSTPQARDRHGPPSKSGFNEANLCRDVLEYVDRGGWGVHERAVERWQRITERDAPTPVEAGKFSRTGGPVKPRVSAAFSEWMMGWPAGWVTDVPRLNREAMLTLIGNGVCPQQAATAMRLLLDVANDY